MNYFTRFEELGRIRDEANLSGDNKLGNKAYKEMEKIYERAVGDSDKEKFYLGIIEMSSSPSALITCCAHMMRMNIKSGIARKKLEEIAKNSTYHPIFQFNAKMFLTEWDKGNIK